MRASLVQDVSHVFETLPHSPGLGEARSPADLFVASLHLTRQTAPWISVRNIVRPLINRGAGSGSPQKQIEMNKNKLMVHRQSTEKIIPLP